MRYAKERCCGMLMPNIKYCEDRWDLTALSYRRGKVFSSLIDFGTVLLIPNDNYGLKICARKQEFDCYLARAGQKFEEINTF